jgi:hypothetical protein
MQMHMDLNDYKIAMLVLEIGCSFEECHVERSIGLKITLNLYQNFRALIFALKKTLPTKKWEALNSCVIFLTEFLQDENLNGLSFPSLMLCLEFSFELLLNMYEGYFPVNKMAISSSTWPYNEDLRFTSMDRSRFGDLSIKTHSVTSDPKLKICWCKNIWQKPGRQPIP